MGSTDPVLARRGQIARLVGVSKRIGYGLYGVAIVGFFVGFAVRYTTALTTTIVVCMAIGSIVLAPAIVFGYGVRAAEREERRAAVGHGPRPTAHGEPVVPRSPHTVSNNGDE